MSKVDKTAESRFICFAFLFIMRIKRREMNMFDVVIIGAGVTGSAIAREISRYKLKACVIEKEEDVCNETSKANSAIIHAGFDAVPGTEKAKLK